MQQVINLLNAIMQFLLLAIRFSPKALARVPLLSRSETDRYGNPTTAYA